MQNKANWEEVSSLKSQVSSSGPALQTPHVTLHTPLKPPYGVSKGHCAKQSQSAGSRLEAGGGRQEATIGVVQNKANLQGG